MTHLENRFCFHFDRCFRVILLVRSESINDFFHSFKNNLYLEHLSSLFRNISRVLRIFYSFNACEWYCWFHCINSCYDQICLITKFIEDEELVGHCQFVGELLGPIVLEAEIHSMLRIMTASQYLISCFLYLDLLLIRWQIVPIFRLFQSREAKSYSLLVVFLGPHIVLRYWNI